MKTEPSGFPEELGVGVREGISLSQGFWPERLGGYSYQQPRSGGTLQLEQYGGQLRFALTEFETPARYHKWRCQVGRGVYESGVRREIIHMGVYAWEGM